MIGVLAKIAWRNIVRNRRRSLMTASAVAAGALALLLFLGYTTYIFLGMETGNVQHYGHLRVFRSGYFLYGAGNPSAYGIDAYRDVMRVIGADPVLAPMIAVLTPTQNLMGIAANYQGDNSASRTFFGEGIVPSDRARMRRWDEYHTSILGASDPGMTDDEASRGVVGTGLARILNLCTALALANCPPGPTPAHTAEQPGRVNADIAELAARDTPQTARGPAHPHIDLLAATVGGAPNVVSLDVVGAQAMGAKELDDAYVLMNLTLAQQLVYGREEHKVTAIVLQLRQSRLMGTARARLNALFRERHLDLEVRDFGELVPFYGQVIRLFSSIFLFIALVMGMIVLFAVVNTMTMNVMERINEIGTSRAMGVRRSRIRAQFLMEGTFIGLAGTAVGAALALLIASAVNRAGITWVPPGNAIAIPLHLDVFGRPLRALAICVGLVLVATAAALLPANRAARLSVVDALRHI